MIAEDEPGPIPRKWERPRAGGALPDWPSETELFRLGAPGTRLLLGRALYLALGAEPADRAERRRDADARLGRGWGDACATRSGPCPRRTRPWGRGRRTATRSGARRSAPRRPGRARATGGSSATCRCRPGAGTARLR